MGTILVKSALNALKIEVFKKIFFSLKKLNFVAHFLLLTFSENCNKIMKNSLSSEYNFLMIHTNFDVNSINLKQISL